MQVRAGDHEDAANPRAEAFRRLGGRFEVRVLEPSPPAVADGPWCADDPVARGDVQPGRQVVAPVAGCGDVTWDELGGGDPELASWCSQRWLGAYRQLRAAPAGLVQTRLALHRLAEHVIAPARQAVNGKIGLRYTRGGFGTPFFGEDVQVRVEGARLHVVRGGADVSAPITTLADAAALVRSVASADAAASGGEPPRAGEPPGAGDPLEVDADAAAFLGEWYGFAASVLEELRAGAGAELDPSRVQLWPEHFDLAVEIGDEPAGQRAAYGCSPGDEHHPEPYLYVGPWQPPPEGELWQATGFSGAERPYRELLACEGQRAAALAFFRARLAALTGAGGAARP